MNKYVYGGLPLRTVSNRHWSNGAYTQFVILGYGLNLQNTGFERVDFYPDFTQLWGASGCEGQSIYILPRWMTSEL